MKNDGKKWFQMQKSPLNFKLNWRSSMHGCEMQRYSLQAEHMRRNENEINLQKHDNQLHKSLRTFQV